MRHILTISLMLSLIACTERESVKPNNAPEPDFEFVDNNDVLSFDAGISTDVDGQELSYQWTSSTEGIINTRDSNEETFDLSIPPRDTDWVTDITLTVSDGIAETSVSKNIAIPALTKVREYGLGKKLVHEVNNTVAYEWYWDQGGTGTFSEINCGPASATMAIKWADSTFEKTPVHAREIYHKSGGWWYTADIFAYLANNGVNNYVIPYTSDDLKTEINQGNIVILCLDSYLLMPHEHATHRYGRFYPVNGAGAGHFIVVKGYKEVDNETWFETYDPFSMGKAYSTGQLKGKDRYYNKFSISSAVQQWWPYAIVVSRSSGTNGRKAVDPKQIFHMPGM